MSLRRRIAAYALIFFAGLSLASLLLWQAAGARRFAPDPAGALPAKTAFYLAHAAEYDLLFLGDSRTFCAFHPELLDPLLGVRGFNASYWANWLPTQYAHLRAMAGRIPPGTTVVWSLGESNFGRPAIYDTYPIALADAARLVRMGIGPGELTENFLAYNPLTYLYFKRGALLERALELAARPVLVRPSAAVASPFAALAARYAVRPGVARAEVQAPEGAPVAVSQFMAGGGYLLDELDPAHFRARQKPGAPPPSGPLVPDASRWAVFLGILDEMRAQGLRVVVNAMEEAPYTYGGEAGRKRARDFMDGPVRRAAEEHGFIYLRADLDALGDADYFDYDHLNARGVEKFSPVFAKALAPHLLRGRGGE